jgi:hypothetical protein
VIDHEIFSKVICTVPLLLHIKKFQFLAKAGATSTGKLLDNLPRYDAVPGLYSGIFFLIMVSKFQILPFPV